MTIEIVMPALSPTMEVGKISKWHVKAGDTVQAGSIIAEIETDKAIMELEAYEDGIIKELLVAEGSENISVNSAIAIMDDTETSSEKISSKQTLEKPFFVEAKEKGPGQVCRAPKVYCEP